MLHAMCHTMTNNCKTLNTEGSEKVAQALTRLCITDNYTTGLKT